MLPEGAGTVTFDLPILVLGLAGLWGGTLVAVRGAVRLSEEYGWSQGFVGLAVMAVGTDLPELVVALSGSVQELQGVEASGMIVGSAFGSALAQGTLVLGTAGLMGYLPVARRMVRRDGITLLLCVGLAAALATGGRVGRWEGAAMVLAYAIYMVSLIHSERGDPAPPEAAANGGPPAPLAIVVGLTVVVLSAHLVVRAGIDIAVDLGVSQSLLGVLVVGLGTSLPELALSLRAAAERRASLSVGNVIGSNIFDLLVPVGAAAMVVPLTVDPVTLSLDLPALAVATAVLLVFLVRKQGLQRGEAAVLLALYGVYAGVRLWMG